MKSLLQIKSITILPDNVINRLFQLRILNNVILHLVIYFKNVTLPVKSCICFKIPVLTFQAYIIE